MFGMHIEGWRAEGLGLVLVKGIFPTQKSNQLLMEGKKSMECWCNKLWKDRSQFKDFQTCSCKDLDRNTVPLECKKPSKQTKEEWLELEQYFSSKSFIYDAASKCGKKFDDLTRLGYMPNIFYSNSNDCVALIPQLNSFKSREAIFFSQT